MDTHYLKTNVESITSEYETYNITYVINGHGEQPATLEGVSMLPSTFPTLTDTEGRYRFDG